MRTTWLLGVLASRFILSQEEFLGGDMKSSQNQGFDSVEWSMIIATLVLVAVVVILFFSVILELDKMNPPQL